MSIVNNFLETEIQRQLCHTKFFKYQVSCFEPQIKNNKIMNCGKCIKCRRIGLLIQASGKNPKLIGIPKAKDVKETANQLFNTLPGSSDEEAETISYLTGIKIKGIKPIYHKETFDFRLDKKHPNYLSKTKFKFNETE